MRASTQRKCKSRGKLEEEEKIKFLVELLSPFFLSLGLTVLAVAVMIAAYWLVKKGTRHVVRWGAGLSWVLVIVVIVNIISFGPMYNNLAPIINGRGSVSEETVEHSKEVIQEVGKEGMVLLKFAAINMG